jgi:hypothetical protein
VTAKKTVTTKFRKLVDKVHSTRYEACDASDPLGKFMPYVPKSVFPDGVAPTDIEITITWKE